MIYNIISANRGEKMKLINQTLIRALITAGAILFISSWVQLVSANSRQLTKHDEQLYTEYAKQAQHTKIRPMLKLNNPFYAPDQIIYYESQLPQKVTPLHASKIYQNTAEHYPIVQYSNQFDHSEVIHGQATQKQQAELRKYALQLINSYRTTHGASKLEPTKDEDKAVEQTAELRAKAHLIYDHIRFQPDYLKIYNNIGMTLTGENLSTNVWARKALDNHQPVTMLMLKTGIYSTIETMLYADGANRWGHRENFLTADKMDFALQFCGSAWNIPYVYVFEGCTPNNQYLMYQDNKLWMSMTRPEISSKPIKTSKFSVHQTLKEPNKSQQDILRKLQSHSK